MTRIKKRRSGKKRTKDRKKVTAGRRGARAVKKEIITKAKKEASPKPAINETIVGKKAHVSAGTTGKTRSAGARRIAAAKSVVKGDKTDKTVTKAKKQHDGEERPAKKGFAPWNKNKFRKREE